jgi:hypothetical protein
MRNKWKRILVINVILFVIIGYAGYSIYSKQNEKIENLLLESSTLKGSSDRLENEIEDLNVKTSEDKVRQGEKTAQTINEIKESADRNDICRQADNLLLEMKVLCDDVEEDQCIDDTEVEIAKIENREGSLSVMSDEELEKYGIFKKLSGLKEKLEKLSSLKNEYVVVNSQCEK